MKESLFRSFALLFLCIVLVCQAAISFAWFSSTESADVSISGTSISNYFAGGDGSTDNPYIIKFPSNLYYLSWLQNLGRFEEKKYFKISDDITTLDMAGALNGGAIPPIGTEANPFLGEFRGNGKVIANLWVSSNPDDWYVQPAQEAFGDISMDGITDVGFFGYASQKSLEVVNEGDPSVIKAKINNFYLENLEITAHNTDTSVGLIAGYVDCDITAVGVKNGKITVKEASESITLTSDSSLFGKFGDHVYWEESPIGTIGGNKLLIDPNKDGDPFTGISTGYAQVPDSTQDSAFYVSSLGISTNGNTSANRYLYTNTVSWNHESTGTQTHTVGRPNSDLINPEVTDERINSSLWARMQSSMANFITPGDIYTGTGAARTLQTTTITVGGEELTVPKNGIWFKPRSGEIGRAHV